MSAHSKVAQPLQSPRRWVVCALLFLATTINYMDRQVLGLLAPVLQKQIGWTELDYGHIVIAFQAAYAVGLLSFGYLVDVWGTKIGYSLAIVIWSIAAALHAGARNVLQFAGARVILGLGESGNFPTAIKAVAEWFEPSERALATGLFNAGSNVGAIFAPALVPWIAEHYGWQAAFLILAVAGFIWLVLWLALYQSQRTGATVSKEAPAIATMQSEETVAEAEVLEYASNPNPIRWIDLISLRQTWAFIFITMMGSPVGWFFLYWLPKFFSARYGLSLSKLGTPLITVYSMALVGGVIGGLLTPAFLRRGFSLNAGRKGALLICATLMLPVCFATRAPSALSASLMIGLGLAALQGWAANCYTVVSDLFPKRAIASVVGIGAAAGSIASIAFAEFAGQTLEKSGSYTPLFVTAGLACPIGLLMLHLLVPDWKPVDARNE